MDEQIFDMSLEPLRSRRSIDIERRGALNVTPTTFRGPGIILSSNRRPTLAAACGLIVANLYYVQPLVGPISASLGLPPEAAGLIVTMAQIGLRCGPAFDRAARDLVENRNLVLCVIGVAALALFGAALSTQPLQFLFAALLIGLGSVAVQILIPMRRISRLRHHEGVWSATSPPA
jgi:MFS family permease